MERRAVEVRRRHCGEPGRRRKSVRAILRGLPRAAGPGPAGPGRRSAGVRIRRRGQRRRARRNSCARVATRPARRAARAGRCRRSAGCRTRPSSSSCRPCARRRDSRALRAGYSSPSGVCRCATLRPRQRVAFARSFVAGTLVLREIALDDVIRGQLLFTVLPQLFVEFARAGHCVPLDLHPCGRYIEKIFSD